jgi:hypothetical protein
MAQQNELFELLKSGGKIVSSASCTELEIAQARSCDRMYVDKNGFGFVYFPSKVKQSNADPLTAEQKKALIEGLQLYAKNNPTALVATMAQQTAVEKAQELIDKFYEPTLRWSLLHAKKCALIALENEYKSLREQLFNLRSCHVIENEKVYLVRIDFLNKEESELRKEIEKL